MKDKKPLRYEDAAERVTVPAWRCVRCGKADLSEAWARSCCATDRPCVEPGCANRVGRSPHPRRCDACDSRLGAEGWAKRYAEKAVPWDGETYMTMDDGEVLFTDDQAVREHLELRLAEGEKITPEMVAGLRLVLCEPATAPEFEMEEYLADELPDDDHGGHGFDFTGIDRQVNEYLRGLGTLSWWPTGVPVTVDSVWHESWAEG